MEKEMKKRSISAALLCLTCVLIAVFLSGLLCPDRAEIEYPFKKHIGAYNPYEQQFDAFMKGQLHIDLEPERALAELENPYDPYQREGIYYLWDRAYYDGKYFSYFGIAPIITVYYPYYLINNALPADDVVSTAFTVMTALFFAMAAVKLWVMLGKKTPAWLVWILTIGALASTQIFLVMRGATRFYYIATVAGIAFLSAFAWLFLCGISGTFCLEKKDGEGEKPWMRPLIYSLAGLAYGLCFLSRFNMALVAAFVILPMLWFFILKENRNGKYEWRSIKKVSAELIFLALPVALAIIVQLYMNYARFDSVFEFGTTYQLTVSDVSKNKLRLRDLGYAIYHYFLQPLSFTKDFPLASLFYSALDDYGHFVYVDTGMGLLAIPFMWMLAASIFIFADKKKSLGLKAALGSALFGLVFVAWLDFCLGGVIFRYTCDLTVVGALTSLAVAFALAGDEQSNGDTLALAKGMKVILVFVALMSVYVSITLAFSGNVNLTPYSDEVRRVFRALFFK
jgi:hypothetical protein